MEKAILIRAPDTIETMVSCSFAHMVRDIRLQKIVVSSFPLVVRYSCVMSLIFCGCFHLLPHYVKNYS